jgi:hypothetical protein
MVGNQINVLDLVLVRDWDVPPPRDELRLGHLAQLVILHRKEEAQIYHVAFIVLHGNGSAVSYTPMGSFTSRISPKKGHAFICTSSRSNSLPRGAMQVYLPRMTRHPFLKFERVWLSASWPNRKASCRAFCLGRV